MRELLVLRGGKGTESGMGVALLGAAPESEDRNSLTRVSFALRSIDTSFSKA